ncbi:MAG: carboxypeptidase-like regulatory domain-containing protein [Bacteroidota bacterium]
MNKWFKARLRRNKVGLTVYDKHSGVLNGVPALQTAVDDVKVKVEMMESIIAEQESDITGITEQKNKIRMRIIADTLRVSGGLFAYANRIDDSALREASHITRTQLEKKPDNILIPAVQAIVDKVNLIGVGLLATYGITSTVFAEFVNDLDYFRTMSEEPEAARSHSTANNRMLAKLDFEIRKLLSNEVDKLMLAFEITHPEVYLTFANARKVIDPGHRKTAEEDEAVLESGFGLMNITVLDSITNMPVTGAKIIAGETGIEDESDDDGYAYIEKIPKGSQKVHVECDGYEPYDNPNVTVEGSDEVDLVVYLTPVDNTTPAE